MVLLEEPWLERAYGDAYKRYCEAIPRFFNFARLFGGGR
jgi:protein-S-isoprenylcysteine O-methyltransferase Ste14